MQTGKYIWDEVFKNGPSKICGRQPLKHLSWSGVLRQTISLETVFQKFYLVYLEYFVLFKRIIAGYFRFPFLYQNMVHTVCYFVKSNQPIHLYFYNRFQIFIKSHICFRPMWQAGKGELKQVSWKPKRAKQ